MDWPQLQVDLWSLLANIFMFLHKAKLCLSHKYWSVQHCLLHGNGKLWQSKKKMGVPNFMEGSLISWNWGPRSPILYENGDQGSPFWGSLFSLDTGMHLYRQYAGFCLQAKGRRCYCWYSTAPVVRYTNSTGLVVSTEIRCCSWPFYR